MGFAARKKNDFLGWKNGNIAFNTVLWREPNRKTAKSIDKNKVSSENDDTPLFHIYIAFFFFHSPLGLKVGLRFTPLRK